jgi:hypothetical protein
LCVSMFSKCSQVRYVLQLDENKSIHNVRSYGDTKITKVIMLMIIKAVAIVMCQDCTD